MNTRSPFKIHPALALAFAGARGFGVMIAPDGGRPVAASVPFLLIEANGKAPRVAFHVARSNPLAALAVKGGYWLLAVPGADAYVSADWYPGSGQVPTWLYETVQLSGPVQVVPPAHAGEHLDALTERFERTLAPKPPWSKERVAPERLNMLMQSIVAIEMLVESVDGTFKLNQHKNDADYAAVAAALAGQDDAGARTIAARMAALRPHLLYDKPAAAGCVSTAGGGH
jgi:transcriptional regulator